MAPSRGFQDYSPAITGLIDTNISRIRSPLVTKNVYFVQYGEIANCTTGIGYGIPIVGNFPFSLIIDEIVVNTGQTVLITNWSSRINGLYVLTRQGDDTLTFQLSPSDAQLTAYPAGSIFVCGGMWMKYGKSAFTLAQFTRMGIEPFNTIPYYQKLSFFGPINPVGRQTLYINDSQPGQPTPTTESKLDQLIRALVNLGLISTN